MIETEEESGLHARQERATRMTCVYCAASVLCATLSLPLVQALPGGTSKLLALSVFAPAAYFIWKAVRWAVKE